MSVYACVCVLAETEQSAKPPRYRSIRARGHSGGGHRQDPSADPGAGGAGAGRAACGEKRLEH